MTLLRWEAAPWALRLAARAGAGEGNGEGEPDRPGVPPLPGAVDPAALAVVLRKGARAALLRARPGALSPHSTVPVPDDPAAPGGAELREMRERAGLSQRDLEVRAGVSRGLIADVERGRRTYSPSRRRLADALRAALAEQGKEREQGKGRGA